MKIFLTAFLLLSTFIGPALAQDGVSRKELSIRDQIKAARAKDEAESKISGPRPWDRDADGKRPWDNRAPLQPNESK